MSKCNYGFLCFSVCSWIRRKLHWFSRQDDSSWFILRTWAGCMHDVRVLSLWTHVVQSNLLWSSLCKLICECIFYNIIKTSWKHISFLMKGPAHPIQTTCFFSNALSFLFLLLHTQLCITLVFNYLSFYLHISSIFSLKT